jgi:hypothetical protein
MAFLHGVASREEESEAAEVIFGIFFWVRKLGDNLNGAFGRKGMCAETMIGATKT